MREEYKMYSERGLVMLLRAFKYLVDTMRARRIVWGVGRGSAVASYILYIIGVHKAVDGGRRDFEEFFDNLERKEAIMGLVRPDPVRDCGFEPLGADGVGADPNGFEGFQ